MMNGIRVGVGCLLAACWIVTGCGHPTGPVAEQLAGYRQAVASQSHSQTAGSSDSARASSGGLAPGNHWLELGAVLAAGIGEDPTTQPASPLAAEPATQEAKLPYVAWRQRRGPAYPDRYWPSVGRDAKEMPYVLWDDTKATYTSPVVWVGMGAAGAAGIVLNGTGVDDTVANQVAKHRRMNTFWDSTFDTIGNPGTHFAVAGAWYLTALALKDTKSYETAKTMISALSINGATVLILQVAAHTRSPNGRYFGWPSGHTSSSFAVATVMYESYGPAVGIPLMGLAGLVGWERIDAGEHHFSDVISGMLIGIVIGHEVSQHHKHRIFGMTMVPYTDPQTGAIGVGLAKRF